MPENLKPADIHVRDSRVNRIFLYFPRSNLAQQYPEYPEDSIKRTLEEMVAKQPVKVALRPHQFAVTPRIGNAAGQCNWQIVVFLPIPADDLTAITMACADLQKRCNMIDEYQNTRAIIV